MLVVNVGRGGEDVEETEMVGSLVRADEVETCRLLERLMLEREKDDVRLDSMTIVRDFCIGAC